jgi:hypothetical protein
MVSNPAKNNRDPEIRELQRESLRLIVASEKVLTALEDHLLLLRTFVATARGAHLADDSVSDTGDTVHEHPDEQETGHDHDA